MKLWYMSKRRLGCIAMTNVCPTYKGPTAEGGREEGAAWAWQQGVRAKAGNELPRGRQGVRRAAAAAALAACGGGSERAGARSGATRSMPRHLGSSCLLCSRHAQRGTARHSAHHVNVAAHVAAEDELRQPLTVPPLSQKRL